MRRLRNLALSAIGMLVAILATFADRNVLGTGTEAFLRILGAMAVGGAIGAVEPIILDGRQPHFKVSAVVLVALGQVIHRQPQATG